MEKILVSVIIPIYNAEKYLKKNLDSLLNTKLKNIELLLINNNSNDSSKKICLDYRNKDSRVFYLEENKKGAGHARNKGLLEARGEYIVFVDSDDYIEGDMLLDLFKFSKINDLDIVHCGNVNHNKNNITYSYIPYNNFDILEKSKIKDSYIPLLFASFNEKKYKDKLTRAMWAKMFKKDLIEKNEIIFSSHINGQDFLFTLECVCCAKKIGIIKKEYYQYRNNIGETLSKKYTLDRYKRILKLQKSLKDVLYKNNLWNEKIEKNYNEFRRHDIFWVLKLINSELNSQSFYKKYKSNMSILNSKECIEIFKNIDGNYLFRQKLLYFIIKYKFASLFSLLNLIQ